MKKGKDSRIVIHGIPCSPGVRSGKYVKVKSVIGAQREPSIIVIDGPLTVENVVSLLDYAIAVVSRSGGKTAHAASILREALIPLVSGIEQNICQFNDEGHCIVNGSDGMIVIER